MADLNIGEIAATTLRNYQSSIADNITNHNALFHRLNMRGNVKVADGGQDILEQLEYAENGTAGWYSGFEVLDTTPQDVIDAANFDWKQLAGTVVIDGLTEIKNSGKERVFNLLEARIKNLEKSLMNTAATAVYADGTGSSGKELGGLQHLVADDPTVSSTVGGIDAATDTFWQNQYQAAATLTSSNIQASMNSQWLTQVRGTDKPDLIPADSVMYDFYETSLQTLQRFSSAKMADAGFESLKYKTADVIYDDQCPSKHMYFLNTKYIYLRPHKDRQFKVDEKRISINQDACVIPVFWAGNMTCSNRSLQGVFQDD